jgi:hypothetical protein
MMGSRDPQKQLWNYQVNLDKRVRSDHPLRLEVAQHIANHESPRTTKLYDRRQDEISLDEIERIAI